jgi:pSer/pThr/pTyr-binding forkhead associated (FHA) protein
MGDMPLFHYGREVINMQETKSNSGIYLIHQNTGQIFYLDTQKENIIGRTLSEKVHPVLLHHPSISKIHAVIKLESATQRWIFQNLSRNGSMLNGRLVTVTKPIQHGDEITVGPYKLTFYENMAADEGTMEVPLIDDISKSGPNSKSFWEEDDSRDSRVENATIVFFIILALLIFAYYFLKK